MNFTLNVFDQYEQKENRLTYALGVTLERSLTFRSAFLKNLAGNVKLNLNSKIKLQLTEKSTQKNGEKSGIPDLAIIDEDNRAVIIEAKLGASLNWDQLKRHEQSASRNDLEVVAALAVTGRDTDREALVNWYEVKKFNIAWSHVAWQEIYRLASQYASDPWARELKIFMEIMAVELDENEMGADVKIIDFAGISEEMIDDFSPATAKRALQALMSELRSDKSFLKDIGIPNDHPPRNRKAIKNEMPVWDLLSPVKDKDAHTKSHHFTVVISSEHIGALLTIPNASFGKLKKFAKINGREKFMALIDEFLGSLAMKEVIRHGGRPLIIMVQRRYRNMNTVLAVDGRLEFDLRTGTNRLCAETEPQIKQQPEWIEFCHKLIIGSNANIQFQIGTRFDFLSCSATKSKDVVALIKNTFITTMSVVNAIS